LSSEYKSENETSTGSILPLYVKFTNGGLSFFYFIFHFLLVLFFYFFIFLFLEQLGLGLEVICHTVTSVTI